MELCVFGVIISGIVYILFNEELLTNIVTKHLSCGCWSASDSLTEARSRTKMSALSVHDNIFLKVRKLVAGEGEQSNCKSSLFFVNHKKC